MKLRIAKKILSHQDPIRRSNERKYVHCWGNYSKQKLLASIRLFKYGSRNKLGQLTLESLFLRPIGAFQPDDQVDLKFERLIGQYGRNEPLIISKEHFTPPAPDQSKPAYRKDGQIGNPNALPYPGSRDKLTYTHKLDQESGNILIHTDIVYSKVKDRSKQTSLRYQARDNNTRKAPKYHV